MAHRDTDGDGCTIRTSGKKRDWLFDGDTIGEGAVKITADTTLDEIKTALLIFLETQ